MAANWHINYSEETRQDFFASQRLFGTTITASIIDNSQLTSCRLLLMASGVLVAFDR